MQSLEIVRVGKGLPDHNFQDHAPSRHEKSLGLLTTKFVTLLQEAKDGVLDLKVVSARVSSVDHAFSPIAAIESDFCAAVVAFRIPTNTAINDFIFFMF